MDVRLDQRTLKALSNQTRVSILKRLQERRHTQSELAHDLDLSIPTVKQHLAGLQQAELVQMHDEGRKWKYYALTRKAKSILEPEQVNLLIVLSMFVLSVVGGLMSWLRPVGPVMRTAEVADVASTQVMAAEAPRVLPVWQEPLFWGVLVLVFAAALCFVAYRRCRIKRFLGGYLNKK